MGQHFSSIHYDVRAAIEKIIAMGKKPRGIRLDSGDVLNDSIWARQRFNGIGWSDVQIFISGDLDEDHIEDILRNGGCMDSFGVGTALSTSSDAPSVGVIYKLVEVEFHDHVRSTAKFSAEKKTYPGRKQVFRCTNRDGIYSDDVIGLENETIPGTDALLVPVMREGKRLEIAGRDPAANAFAARQRFLEGRRRLPAPLLELRIAEFPYPVRYSNRLEKLCSAVQKTVVKISASEPAMSTVQRSSKTIFWEVDAQADFMFPGGKLYVPGAEKIIPNLNRLVEVCRQGHVFLISETDAHSMTDAELSEWPPHCLKGVPERKSSLRHVR